MVWLANTRFFFFTANTHVTYRAVDVVVTLKEKNFSVGDTGAIEHWSSAGRMGDWGDEDPNFFFFLSFALGWGEARGHFVPNLAQRGGRGSCAEFVHCTAANREDGWAKERKKKKKGDTHIVLLWCIAGRFSRHPHLLLPNHLFFQTLIFLIIQGSYPLLCYIITNYPLLPLNVFIYLFLNDMTKISVTHLSIETLNFLFKRMFHSKKSI